MKIVEKTLATIVTVALIFMLIYGMTSCTPKYGCGHGAPKQSWNKMVRRINSPK